MRNLLYISIAIATLTSCRKERQCVCGDFTITIAEARKKTQEKTCDVWSDHYEIECTIEK